MKIGVFKEYLYAIKIRNYYVGFMWIQSNKNWPARAKMSNLRAYAGYEKNRPARAAGLKISAGCGPNADQKKPDTSLLSIEIENGNLIVMGF